MMRNFVILLAFSLIYSCTTDQLDSIGPMEAKEPLKSMIATEFDARQINLSDIKSGSPEQFMIDINTELINQGLSLQLNTIEYFGNEEAGNTVFFNNTGNKQLSGDFVPGDIRRGGSDDINYALDGTEGATMSGLTQEQTDNAILNAMSTWTNVSCSNGLDLINLGSTNFDLGYVQALLGVGGALLFTDLMHSGFTTTLFDIIFGPGSSVLGVTFTFVFIDDAGNPSDIDNNGKDDVAFRDIYYNDTFSWGIDSNIDVETVALHEAGHGLSQGHFGKAFRSGGNDKLHFAPKAVMNAGYTGVQSALLGTDNAGHCSNWGQWPNN